VYHSLRYVKGLTVIRLKRELSEKTLSSLNREFKDILNGGRIRSSVALEEELERDEYPELARLVMDFNLRDYGRLFELISVINQEG